MPRKGRKITTKAVQASEGKPFSMPDATPAPEVDDAPWGEDGLTTRQRLFVEALVGPAGGNATRAAEMAGYAAENRRSLQATSSDTLSKPMVQRAIARALAKKRLSPEWVRDRLAELAGGSMADFTVFRDGKLDIDWDQVAAAGAIGQVKEVTEDVLPGGTGSKAEVIRRKVKLHDPLPALALLAKLHGQIIDRHEHTGPNGGPIETKQIPDDDRLREIWRRCMGGRPDRSVEAPADPHGN